MKSSTTIGMHLACVSNACRVRNDDCRSAMYRGLSVGEEEISFSDSEGSIGLARVGASMPWHDRAVYTVHRPIASGH
jgi:hypothetical protein